VSGCVRIPEAAALLGVSDRTVYRLVERGDLPTITLGRSIRRIPRRAIDELLERAMDGFDPDRLLASLTGAGGPSSAPTFPASGVDVSGDPAGAAARGERSPGPARLAAVNP